MKLISGFKILNKHKMQAFLMIILSGLLFSLFGSVLNYNNKQKKVLFIKNLILNNIYLILYI